MAVLVSGASGMRLVVGLVRALVARPTLERLHLVVSAGASQVLRHELPAERPGAAGLVAAATVSAPAMGKITVHRDSEIDAPIASGSYRLTGTIVLPCSAATLGAFATGVGRGLIHRAGAVALKERWPLVLGFRETPLSIVHLENLRRLAYAGATVLPPIPAFYLGEELDRFVEAYVLRCFDHLGITSETDPRLRWKPAPEGESPSAPEGDE